MVRVFVDVYDESKALEDGNFKKDGSLDELVDVYVSRDAYAYLPEEVEVDYPGYGRLRVTNYSPVRLKGACLG